MLKILYSGVLTVMENGEVVTIGLTPIPYRRNLEYRGAASGGVHAVQRSTEPIEPLLR